MLVGVSTEGLVMIVAASLYLVDSALFFEFDEGALIRSARGRWFARFGLDRWRLGGKEPYLPNPFAPFQPLIRLKWRFESPAPEWVANDSVLGNLAFTSPIANIVVPKELKPFEIHVSISAGLLFALLPIGLFLPIHVSFLISVVAALYINNLWALLRLMRVRQVFQLDRKGVAALAFECLACPPFSVNLVRRLCVKLALAEDLVAAGARVMSAGDYSQLRAQCLRRIDEQIDSESEETPRLRALLLSRPSYAAGAQTHDSNQHEVEQP